MQAGRMLFASRSADDSRNLTRFPPSQMAFTCTRYSGCDGSRSIGGPRIGADEGNSIEKSQPVLSRVALLQTNPACVQRFSKVASPSAPSWSELSGRMHQCPSARKNISRDHTRGSRILSQPALLLPRFAPAIETDSGSVIYASVDRRGTVWQFLYHFITANPTHFDLI